MGFDGLRLRTSNVSMAVPFGRERDQGGGSTVRSGVVGTPAMSSPKSAFRVGGGSGAAHGPSPTFNYKDRSGSLLAVGDVADPLLPEVEDAFSTLMDSVEALRFCGVRGEPEVVINKHGTVSSVSADTVAMRTVLRDMGKHLTKLVDAVKEGFADQMVLVCQHTKGAGAGGAARGGLGGGVPSASFMSSGGGGGAATSPHSRPRTPGETALARGREETQQILNDYMTIMPSAPVAAARPLTAPRPRYTRATSFAVGATEPLCARCGASVADGIDATGGGPAGKSHFLGGSGRPNPQAPGSAGVNENIGNPSRPPSAPPSRQGSVCASNPRRKPPHSSAAELVAKAAAATKAMAQTPLCPTSAVVRVPDGAATLTPAAFLSMFCTSAARSVGADRCSVWLFGVDDLDSTQKKFFKKVMEYPRGEPLGSARASGTQSGLLSTAVGLVPMVFEARVAINLVDAPQSALCTAETIRELGPFQDAVVMPLFRKGASRGQCVGVVVFLDKHGGAQRFSTHDEVAAAGAAEVLSAAIDCYPPTFFYLDATRMFDPALKPLEAMVTGGAGTSRGASTGAPTSPKHSVATVPAGERKQSARRGRSAREGRGGGNAPARSLKTNSPPPTAGGSSPGGSTTAAMSELELATQQLTQRVLDVRSAITIYRTGEHPAHISGKEIMTAKSVALDGSNLNDLSRLLHYTEQMWRGALDDNSLLQAECRRWQGRTAQAQARIRWYQRQSDKAQRTTNLQYAHYVLSQLPPEITEVEEKPTSLSKIRSYSHEPMVAQHREYQLEAGETRDVYCQTDRVVVEPWSPMSSSTLDRSERMRHTASRAILINRAIGASIRSPTTRSPTSPALKKPTFTSAAAGKRSFAHPKRKVNAPPSLPNALDGSSPPVTVTQSPVSTTGVFLTPTFGQALPPTTFHHIPECESASEQASDGG